MNPPFIIGGAFHPVPACCPKCTHALTYICDGCGAPPCKPFWEQARTERG